MPDRKVRSHRGDRRIDSSLRRAPRRRPLNVESTEACMCSYCGCRTFTVIARLTVEHEQIVNALGDLVRAADRGDTAATSAAVEELMSLLGPHTRFEEQGLFAELSDDDVLGPHVAQLCAEHVEIDALVARIGRGDLAAAPSLEQLLRRHIDREENGLFPAAAISLDGAAWDRAESGR